MNKQLLSAAIAFCVIAVLVLGFVIYHFTLGNNRAASPPPQKPNIQNLQQQYSQSYTQGYMYSQSGGGGQVPPYARYYGQGSAGH
ncbi:hypothetical protein CTKA_00298 [Chthonomonas calidirosea]|uniref:Uncharacterized protein n=1 Tax=Chthonomonas calidirosea (strain DSM 23976 / ICMP 18418 / T49) TaxID=1303518 RepID=S0ET98_CHTCT|nr:hypothetical protein [Chthonomonas calidirosea]CCW34683.1 hypothetical protein CCALI_00860 [Chthonomonas calidirosea T49]CEK14088.1 hypothetical protein CTKA_00298 [Chthonomonas calidirosea]